MDFATLAEAMGYTQGVDYAALVEPFNEAMIAADITNSARAAMWCAQIGHESAGLRYMEEIHDGSNYEWRKDLGNVYAGDGRRYKGRGPIQLTGRNNYRAFTRWAQANGHTNLDFEADPGLVSQPRWGFLAATYYWVAARPQINAFSDHNDLGAVTKAINGGLNGLDDRRRRWNRCIGIGNRLLPRKRGPVREKVLDYDRDQVWQDTIYNCGPASTQTIVKSATDKFHTEYQLGRELGTYTGGTDSIRQFPAVLNRYMPDAKYVYVEMPQDPPSPVQKDRLWDHITNSIDAGFGVVANIVAPASNYPRAVAPSTISPAYSGGTVYHYVAVMGYSDSGQRKYWIADSGFMPYGYWISHEQLASLIPPKGYAYATATPKGEGFLSALSPQEQRELFNMTKVLHREFTQKYPSRSTYRKNDEPVDTAVGMLLNVDARAHEDWIHARAAEAGVTPQAYADRVNGVKR